jgi:hypothetical protein
MPAAWFMITSWSRPVWHALSPLAAIQFPWRFLGPFSLSLALTVGALYAWLAHQQRQHWVLAGVLLLFLAVNGGAGRPGTNRFVDYAALAPWPARLRSIEGESFTEGTTTTYGEYLPRSVALERPIPFGRGGKSAYEGWFPSGGWIGGQVWPYAGQVDVSQVWQFPSALAARVTVGDDRPAEVAFHALVFAGWRATIDGAPVPVRPAPYEPEAHIGHGFAIVSVPPGEHLVQYVFGPTPWRVLGTALSIVAVGTIVATLISLIPAPRPVTRSLVAAALVVAGIGVVAVIGQAVSLAFRSPPLPAPKDAVVALNALDAVASGHNVSISTPAGGELGDSVAIGAQEIGGERRRWLYMHPPSSVEMRLDVPSRAVFQAGLGIDPNAWDQPNAGSARFIVEVVDGADRQRLLDTILRPQTQEADRGWRFALVDLGSFAGRTITLALRTEAVDTPFYVWSGWATPTVYVDRSPRYPPPSGVAPAPHAHAAPESG